MAENFSWYKTGTVSINQNSTAVGGANTKWVTGGINAGDVFIIGTEVYEIASVNSETSLTLASSHTSAAVSGAAYAIITGFNKTDNAKFASKAAELAKSVASDRMTKVALDSDITSTSATSAMTARNAAFLETTKLTNAEFGPIANLKSPTKTSAVAGINSMLTVVGSLSDLDYGKDNIVLLIANLHDRIGGGDHSVRFNVDISGVAAANLAGVHNSFYRGKNLGTEVTAAQYASIAAGTFDDMFIGDYWTINNVKWRIAHFNYWLHCGDTECTVNHVNIVPDEALGTGAMNATATTAGGYLGSEMHNTTLDAAKTTINDAFGEAHILQHRELLSNAVANGLASGWVWANSTVDLMSSVQVYGAKVVGFGDIHLDFNTGIDCVQYRLFKVRKDLISPKRYWWWLRDVASASYFALCSDYGYAATHYRAASDSSGGVRPTFAIRQAA